MKIALVGPVYPYRGGIAHHTTLLAQALAQTHQVQTISFRRQYPRWLYPGRSDRDPSVQPLRVTAEYLLDPFDVRSWWRTAERIEQFAPDIVVMQWWTTFWAPAFAMLARRLRQNGRRVLYLIHNVLPHEPRRVDRSLARWALRSGSVFITQAERERARLQTMVPHADVAVCAMPVFDSFNAGHIDRNCAREQLHLPPDIPIVLFFGIVRAYKGLRDLLDAVAQLKHNAPVQLVIAGEFWDDKARYLQQIAQLGIGDCVRIESYYIPNEQVSLFFSAADVFAAPYVAGTQSGALKLALGFGLPIVLTTTAFDSAGLPCDTPSIYIVPPRDPRALADALGCAARLPCERRALPDNVQWSSLVRAIEKAASAEHAFA